MGKIPEKIYRENLRAVFEAAGTLPHEERRAMGMAMRQVTKAFKAAQTRQNEAEKLATTDALTNIPNRAGIMQDLYGRVENMKRYGNKDLAVVFVDLDGFKALNDNCGHDSGDDALKKTAARLKSAFRKTDFVGRLGGDEMLLLLSYEKGEELSINEVKNKVRKALKGLVYWNDKNPFPVGASIGISVLGRNDVLPENIKELSESLISAADKLMYQDKSGKRARLDSARKEALEVTPSSHNHL